MLTFLGNLKLRQYGKYLAIAAVIFVVFFAGDLTGSGRLRLTRNQFAGNTTLPSNLDYNSVNQLYDTLRQNYNGTLTTDQLLNGIKHGLATGTGDPYTEYFTAKEAETFNNALQGTFAGIGAELDTNSAGDIIVTAPVDGSPAAKAGLRAQDVISEIDGKSTQGLTVNDAVLKIRGPAGSQVSLTIIRGTTQQLTLTITRADVQAPTATSKILDGNIGYISLTQFASNTDSLVGQIATKFQQAGIKKIILDLRNNGGGEVDAAVNISSNWLTDDQVVFQERRGSEVVATTHSTGLDPFHGIPTVILVNAGTASAAEITAAALHDNKAGTIIGVKTYGKGVEQNLINMPDGGQLKVTIASWYRPNGTNINKKGITPDQVVTVSDDDYKNGTDPQLNAGEVFLNK